MVRITPIHYRKLVKVFEIEGMKLVRQKGDHLVFDRKDLRRPVVIPMYSSVPTFIILKNLKTAGISREKYFEILKKV